MSEQYASIITAHEAETKNSPELLIYLTRANWGEGYPDELIALSPEEQRIDDLLSSGMRLAEIEGEPTYNSGLATIARGKHELQTSRNLPVEDLSENAHRVLVLNTLSESIDISTVTHSYTRRAETLVATINTLDSIFGSGKWVKSGSRLLHKGKESIQAKAELYDELLGLGWKVNPKLLINSLRTVMASKRALEYLGITPDKIPPSRYYQLLGTTTSAKQKHAIFIRRSILGHAQIRSASQKRRKSTMVTRRLRQTEADKQTELAEIEELKVFLKDVGAICLISSHNVIAGKAYDKGYLKSKSD